MNAVRSIVVGLVCMSAVAVTARSAVGAQVDHFVEYVQATGSQWVPVSHRFAGDTRVEMRIKVANSGSSWDNTVFSARGAGGGGAYCLHYRTGKYGWAFDYNEVKNSTDTTLKIDDTKIHDVVTCPTGVYEDGVLRYAKSRAYFTTPNTLVLFAMNGTNWPNPPQPSATSPMYGKVTLYSFKAYDGDGRLFCDLRPCVDTDGVVAIYDAATGEICYNQSETTLTAGEPVETFTDLLPIRSTPAAYGAVDPDYGVVTGLEANAALTLTAPAAYTNASGTLVANCVGYRHWTNGVLYASGEGTSYDYVHLPAPAISTFEWRWQEELPQSDIVYVAENGDDETADGSRERPYRNIQTAISNAADGATVLVGDGRYLVTDKQSMRTELKLDKSVKVRSVNGPERTILDCNWTTTGANITSGNMRGIWMTHENAVVEGLTVIGCRQVNTQNASKQYETCVTVTAGMITNCVFRDFASVDHDGAIKITGTGRIVDSLLDFRRMGVTTGSASQQYGLYLAGNAVADGVEVSGFTFSSKASSKYTSPVILASANAVLKNSFIHDNDIGGQTSNTANGGGGVLLGAGTVDHCTIVANSTANYGGGIRVTGTSNCSVKNTIVWGNTAYQMKGHDVYCPSATGVFVDSCAGSFEDVVDGMGTGCTSSDPLFSEKEPYHLTLASLAQHEDMGCFPLESGTSLDPVLVASTVESSIRSGDVATLTASVVPAGGSYTFTWDFGDGEGDTGATVEHVYPGAGRYEATVTATPAGGGAALTVTVAVPVIGDTCYVSETGANLPPYDTWERAATTLFDALALKPANIVVTNGTYDLTPGYWTISDAITVTSVEGPEKTTLHATSGSAADPMYLRMSAEGALVSGFTFTGATYKSIKTSSLYVQSAGTVSNCVFKFSGVCDKYPFVALSGSAKVLDSTFDFAGAHHNFGEPKSDYTYSGINVTGNALLDRCVVKRMKFDNTVRSATTAPVRLSGAGATLRNSLVTGCTNGTSLAAGGIIQGPGGVHLIQGMVENCTIAGNYSTGKGGGLYVASASGCTVRNTIVWGNRSLTDQCHDVWNDANAGAITYTCASDLDGTAGGVAEGCSTSDPQFAAEGAPYHLSALSSACVDKGLLDGLVWDPTLDLDGSNRVVGAGIDLGCYEYVPDDKPLPLAVNAETAPSQGRAPLAVACRTLAVVGNTDDLAYCWSFGDGSSDADSADADHTYDAPGVYTNVLTVTNGKGERVAVTNLITVVPPVCYVSPSGGHVHPFDSWEKAATNVMDAVTLQPRKLLVTNGTYVVTGGIKLLDDVEMTSVEGRDRTALKAAPNGKCQQIVWLANAGATVRGFTLLDGWATGEGSYPAGKLEAGTIEDCAVTNLLNANSTALFYANGGTIRRCRFSMPQAYSGTGSTHGDYFGTLQVTGNAIMENCEVVDYKNPNTYVHYKNAAITLGGNAQLRNTLVANCDFSTEYDTGKATRSCVMATGDGVRIDNCTFVGNTTWRQGGALLITASGVRVRNCVFKDNVSVIGVGNDFYDSVSSTTNSTRVSNSCSRDLVTGQRGNVNADPRLGAGGNPYLPAAGSPCINAGAPLEWMDGATTDLGGAPRKYGRKVDMGCYESPYVPGLMLLVR